MKELSERGGLISLLDEEQRLQFLTACSWRDYCRGEIVFQEGEESTDVYCIATGRAVSKGFSADGREVIYHIYSANELFGEYAAIDGGPRAASVEVAENSRIGKVSGSSFRRILESSPPMALALIENLVRRNRLLTLRIFEFGTKLVRERIPAELIRLARPADGRFAIDPAPSHHEFAARLGTHREAVSKELSKLARSGVIHTARRRILILDMDRLRRLAGLAGSAGEHHNLKKMIFRGLGPWVAVLQFAM